MRRALESVAALLGLVLALPILLVVAVAIKLDSRGPVFYRQYRVGEGGRHFSIVKFAPCGSTPSRRAPSGPRRTTRA